MKFILIHGSFGNPQENWFPWLKEQLESKGHEVIAPAFPTPENQSLDSWKRVFEEYIPLLDEETVLIGHSLGPAFILNVLERIETPIRSSIFVAGFLGLLDNEEFDKINATFTDKTFNWKTIQKNCKEFKLFNSSSDPYVPIEKGKELAAHLGVEMQDVLDAGHFNESAGYTSFPLLIGYIEKELL